MIARELSLLGIAAQFAVLSDFCLGQQLSQDCWALRTWLYKKSLPIGYKFLANNIFFVSTDGRTKLCVEVASCLKSGSILYTEFFKKITFLNRRASFG